MKNFIVLLATFLGRLKRKPMSENLIFGAKIYHSLIPRKVITEHLDFIPIKLEWRWLSKIQRLRLDTQVEMYSYYAIDHKEL